jgi:hypothetical protein
MGIFVVVLFDLKRDPDRNFVSTLVKRFRIRLGNHGGQIYCISGEKEPVLVLRSQKSLSRIILVEPDP